MGYRRLNSVALLARVIVIRPTPSSFLISVQSAVFHLVPGHMNVSDQRDPRMGMRGVISGALRDDELRGSESGSYFDVTRGHRLTGSARGVVLQSAPQWIPTTSNSTCVGEVCWLQETQMCCVNVFHACSPRCLNCRFLLGFISKQPNDLLTISSASDQGLRASDHRSRFDPSSHRLFLQGREEQVQVKISRRPSSVDGLLKYSKNV